MCEDEQQRLSPLHSSLFFVRPCTGLLVRAEDDASVCEVCTFQLQSSQPPFAICILLPPSLRDRCGRRRDLPHLSVQLLLK